MNFLKNKNILLIIGGGIAACKVPDLIRRFRDSGALRVSCVMTEASQKFITPLTVKVLSRGPVFTDLFDSETAHDVNHIQLSREADVVVVAPATANLMAKLANGLADDLASAILLASDKAVLMAPAMNPKMWSHAATRRNKKTLENDGIIFIGPEIGEMAERDEAGEGRMSEPREIIAAVQAFFKKKNGMLKGKKIIVTSGPTYEPIDPVRYIGNRSSGKQGHAIAAAFANLGADVYLVSGPTSIESPDHVSLFRVETAQEMEQKVISLLPADLAVFVAAVADWKVADEAREKIKKNSKKMPAVLHLVENPDILYNVAHHDNRPCLIAGFAAETENIEQNAYEKRLAKGADFMIANNVRPEKGTIGGDYNHVSLISQSGISQWPMMSKKETAQKLAEFLAEQLEEKGFSRK